jgi:hypothetical protein
VLKKEASQKNKAGLNDPPLKENSMQFSRLQHPLWLRSLAGYCKPWFQGVVAATVFFS